MSDHPVSSPAMASGRNMMTVTIVLALLSCFPPVATDMYLSGMDQIAQSLQASAAAVEMSLSLFFLGLCVGQLVMGPMIDAYGRKGPLLIGSVVFTLCSALLLLVPDVRYFNALRAVQAMGACAGLVVGRAIVADLYQGRAAAKVMTILVMLMTMGPVLSPFIGSLLVEAYGWHSIFVVMVVIGVIAVPLAQMVLPETLPKSERGSAPFRHAFAGYGILLRSKRFVLSACVAALVQAVMFAFITASSAVFIAHFGLSNVAYGVMFGVIAAALVVFSRINSKLLDWLEPRQIVARGLPLLVAMGGVLTAVSGAAQMWVVVVPLWIVIGLVGLLSANLMSIGMDHARGRAGIGSALIGAIQFGTAFVVSAAVALIPSQTALPLALGIVVPSAAGYGLWICLQRAERTDLNG
ncbi:Bcr/CflA family drug resistance efflux transporter [Thioclava sp. SK-1]|uniref:multidrug effflux MFS transporter n=1 Tax=Thioclava sp. SK-1 TaxID=1889770 RepID=UPI0008253A78|nr:multidrug effflux MFS transporter [Thioclava sp. SK-1]OCX61155.1 Bcr/CflA family drug resistance efflux transporter [Thioclava sp. SK-1]